MNIELPPTQQSHLEGHVATAREVQVGIEQADRGELFDHDSVFQRVRSVALAADEAARR
jgi:hypothetical protein